MTFLLQGTCENNESTYWIKGLGLSHNDELDHLGNEWLSDTHIIAAIQLLS